MNSNLYFIEKYSSELTLLLFLLLVFVSLLFVWVWLNNRKKYQMLKHQIPANVVKNYLDSIIQNSTSLKSSLFRGGGLDADLSSVPSVLPLADLPGGTQVGLDDSDIASLKAKISNLETAVVEKNNVIRDLEDLKAQNEGDIKTKNIRIKELEALLEKQSENSEFDTSEFDAKIARLEKEIKDLTEQLQEYEVISADIANMKKLRDENNQLRKTLEDLNSGSALSEDSLEEEPKKVAEPLEEETKAQLPEEAPKEEAVKVASSDEETDAATDEKTQEETLGEPEKEVTSEKTDEQGAEENKKLESAENTEDDSVKSEKTPEDLLSEFEKMLG